MPFREVSARFDDGHRLRVTRTLAASDSVNKPKSTLTLRLYKGRQLEETFVLRSISSDEFPYPLSSIDEWIPTLDRIAPRLWQSLETGETLNLDDVIDKHSHEFPPDPRATTGVPDWVTDLQRAVPIYFINAERLTVPAPERYRRTPRRSTPTKRAVRAVNVYSDELRRRIQKTLASYGSLSQSLDRTLLTRLVTQPRQLDIEISKLRDDLKEIEDKRRQLAKAGLLKQEDVGLNVPALDIADVDKSRLDVLEMFTQDTRTKLRVFDEILAKVQTLERIANARFLQKTVAVNEDGIVVTTVTTSGGKPLKLAMLSSGEQHELVLLYSLLFRVPPGALIMIDEPELSMHVAWQDEFLSDIGDIAALSDCRVLLATHSPQIIGERYDLTIALERPN